MKLSKYDLNTEDFFVIKIQRKSGYWHATACVENACDAICVARMYRDVLHHHVQMWHGNHDLTYWINAYTIDDFEDSEVTY